MKYKSLLCTLCGNHDDRKPASVYAGETCIVCNKGTLRVVDYEYEGPTSATLTIGEES